MTFSGLTDGSSVLTEANSSLTNGQLSFDGHAAVALTTSGVTLGSTTLTQLAADINAANSGAYTATVGGTPGAVTLTIAHATIAGDTGFAAGVFTGALSNYNAHAADSSTVGSVAYNTVASLSGGQDNGLGYNSTSAVGTSLDNIITSQNQQAASSKIVFPSIQAGDLNGTSNFGGSSPVSITIGSGASQVAFKFTNNANSASATEIQIGATLQDTLANAAAKINSFRGTGVQNYVFDQINATSDGNSITISGKAASTVNQIDQSTAVTIAASGASASVTSAALNNSSSGGVDVSGINNTAFTGAISGFTATANGTANQANISVKIGISPMPPATCPRTRCPIPRYSWYPLIQPVKAVHSPSSCRNSTVSASIARVMPMRWLHALTPPFSGLTFFQTRQVSSYDPTSAGSAIISNGVSIGSLNGSSISLTSNDFTNAKFTGISVSAPQGSNTNGQITFSANGQDYVSDANIGTKLNANSSYTFTSATDPNQKITFKTGSTAIDFSTTDKANAVQNALVGAFGSSGDAIKFQIGSGATDTIGVSIGDSSSNALFNGQSLDVKTQDDASAAASTLNDALNTVTSLRATVGALEERFNYASTAIQNAAQNQGAAKSTLLDTDVAAASTSFATSQVQLQAGIAILAQANQLQQNLLKLIP